MKQPTKTAAPAPRPKTAADLTDQQLKDIGARLLVYARGRARYFRWSRGSTSDALAQGKTIESVAQDAIASLFGTTKRAPWDSEREPDVERYLRSIVNSVLSNLAKLKENTTRHADDGPVSVLEQIAGAATPLDLLLEKEDARWRSRGYDLLLASLDDDLTLIHDLIVNEQIMKPAEIAKRLDRDVKSIYRLKEKYSAIVFRIQDQIERERAAHEAEGKHAWEN